MKLPIFLTMLCIAAWAVMAAGATPSTSLAPTTPKITTTPSPTLFQYLLWIVSPTIQLVVGNIVMQSDAVLISGGSNWRQEPARTKAEITHRKMSRPEAPTDRPKPHTQSSERAVPSLPDG